MPVVHLPVSVSRPPSRKSKLRSTWVQLPGPANHLSFCFSSAKAAKTRPGVAFQRRVIVKLACTTERAVMAVLSGTDVGVVEAHDAAREGFGLDQLQPGLARSVIIFN